MLGFFSQNACFRDSRDSDHFRDPGFLRETRVLRDSEGSGKIKGSGAGIQGSARDPPGIRDSEGFRVFFCKHVF